MSGLRQIIETASDAVATYKSADIQEARGHINKLLHAAKLGGIGSDEVTDIRVGKEEVNIYTRYSVRNCEQRAEHSFPTFVLDADDPIASITAWGKDRRIAKAKSQVKEAARWLEWRQQQLAEAEAS